MSENSCFKPDNEKNISNNTIYFAGRLLKEQGSLNWVPDWLVETPGISGAALGINWGQQCKVYFAGQDKNGGLDSLEIAPDILRCPKYSLGNKAVPCTVCNCPAEQRVKDKCGQSDQKKICFSLAGGKGFLMAWGDTLPENNFPFTKFLKEIAYLVDSSLDTGKWAGSTSSYFLPSEDVAQMWSEMLAGLSHDLRTPLACIKGYVTTLLREDVTWETEEQKEFLNIISEETDHIESLINNLLDSSTFSWNGAIELKKEPISLPQIVNKVLRDPSFQNKRHQFTVQFPEGFPPVEADPSRIEQVLRNLVDNAVKYSMENTRITIKGEQPPGEVVVSVADQGIGIGDEHLSRLFEKFFRVMSKGEQKYQKGMGLGLPLARQVLISHGGRIWAKSKLKQGTTLYFALPCNISKTAGLPACSGNDRGLPDEP
ncbi:MAG: hypothetical protein JL50_20575 [Peptococcaceae bacterium BICA1-7]|nr:MAG: hypothetical protein JL50_20575 [Peptococcaceae bacterium BICA1-7]HBV98477.1 sensor histidine kinase [Desulfotomaculum sp.]